MTRDEFLNLLDHSLSTIAIESTTLFDAGVPPQDCIRIALAIVESKAKGRLQQKPTIVSPFAIRPNG